MFFNNILGLCKAWIVASFINYELYEKSLSRFRPTNNGNSSSNGDPTN